MTQHSDNVYLSHILAHAREALDIYSEHSGREFAHSRVFQLALLHLTEIIGEAASNVSAATRFQLSQLSWRGMTGMRNRIIHGYGAVNITVLRDTLEHDLPERIAVLETCLYCKEDNEKKPER